MPEVLKEIGNAFFFQKSHKDYNYSLVYDINNQYKNILVLKEKRGKP